MLPNETISQPTQLLFMSKLCWVFSLSKFLRHDYWTQQNSSYYWCADRLQRTFFTQPSCQDVFSLISVKSKCENMKIHNSCYYISKHEDQEIKRILCGTAEFTFLRHLMFYICQIPMFYILKMAHMLLFINNWEKFSWQYRPYHWCSCQQRVNDYTLLKDSAPCLLGWYLSEQKALINSWLADVLHRLLEFKLLCIVEYVNSWQLRILRCTGN